ncbi:hypothetical protein XELAEV_18043982mg [Xenopus laevis]|uniref:Uncharacterized protein n=1 Tax=Xenopus laevis TaxID=8355 RepID=A0A974BXX4_XENLA|nr:hypothetical protein XELAEV_18043982mg [Xenopus laevis]
MAEVDREDTFKGGWSGAERWDLGRLGVGLRQYNQGYYGRIIILAPVLAGILPAGPVKHRPGSKHKGKIGQDPEQIFKCIASLIGHTPLILQCNSQTGPCST